MNLSKNNSDLSWSPLKIGGGTPESARLLPLLGGSTGGGADVFQAARIHRSGGCNVKGFWGGDWRVHHVTHVTVLGVGLGPVSKAKLIVVIDLVGEMHHPSVFCKFFLVVEVE